MSLRSGVGGKKKSGCPLHIRSKKRVVRKQRRGGVGWWVAGWLVVGGPEPFDVFERLQMALIRTYKICLGNSGKSEKADELGITEGKKKAVMN